MDLPPFLLNQWLSKYDSPMSPAAYNLASSTGPRWSLDELIQLGGGHLDLGPTVMRYGRAEGSWALREAVADFHHVDPEGVVITTGASEALSLLLFLVQKPGGNIVAPDPGYPAYAAMARAFSVTVRHYNLLATEGFAQDAETALAVTNSHTVAVIVNTPHNPTGSVMERSEITQLAGALAQRGIPLIVDEVYHPLYFDRPLQSAAGTDNVIVISDMSKALSMPGLRTGWVIDRDPIRRQRIVDARSYFTISGSPLLEKLATHALECRANILNRLHDVATRNRIRLRNMIDRSAGALAWTPPRGGTTAFPWFAYGRNSRPFCRALADAGVLVIPGDCFGHDSHLRIGLAQEAEDFQLAMEIMGEQLGR